MIATASAAMAKGDTVYFENQVGEWTDVSGDVGFSADTHISNYRPSVASSDGRYVYTFYSTTVYRYDTTTIPWTKETYITSEGGNITALLSDGDIGLICIDHAYNLVVMNIVLFDIDSGNILLNETEISREWTGNNNLVDFRIGFQKFEDYLCFNAIHQIEQYVNRINLQTNIIERTRVSYESSSNNYYTNVTWENSNVFYYGNGNNSLLSKCIFQKDGYATQLIRTTGNRLYGKNIGVIFKDNKIYHDYTSGADSGKLYFCEVLENSFSTREEVELPTGFVVTHLINSGFDKTRSRIVMQSSNNAVGIMDLSTQTWNVIGYASSLISVGVLTLSNKYTIVGNTVFYNSGAGTIAHKAYNNLHGSSPLGYALKDMSAGEKAKYRVLFD